MTKYNFFLDFWLLLPLVAMAFCLYVGNKFGKRSRCCRKTRERGNKADPASDKLYKRYAQGKIDLKEYEEIKRALIIA